MIDWLRHLRVRPYPNGIYPHPGMWLTRGDYSEHLLVWWTMRFDVRCIAPIMCRLGLHRWITVGDLDGGPWRTRCWYCEKRHR